MVNYKVMYMVLILFSVSYTTYCPVPSIWSLIYCHDVKKIML